MKIYYTNSGADNILLEKVPLWQRVTPRVLESVAWYPVRAMLKYFLHMKIYGVSEVKKAEKIKKEEKRPVLFVSNHISELDPILTTMATSPFSGLFPLFWVARPGRNYKDPDFSWRKYIYGDLFFLSWGAQPIKSGKKDYAYSLQRHMWLLKNGYSVCIFPEGGYDPAKKRVRGGVGYIVSKLNPIIILIKIDGIENISQKEFWARKRRLKLYFKLLDLGKLNANSKDEYKELANMIMNKIYQLDKEYEKG